MTDKEAIQARVTKLHELYSSKLSEAENPRANTELRGLRKKLKRAQRKLRLVKAIQQKGQEKAVEAK